MAHVTRFFTIFLFLVLALHLWAALSPSHYNWGLHDFAFHGIEWGVIALAVCLLVLIPGVQRAATERLSSIVRSFGRWKTGLIFLLLLLVWVGMMYLFPARLHLLGDSELILALTPKLPSIEDVSANFRNQPLTYEALRLVQWVTGGGGAVEPMTLYRIADGIAGVIYLGLIFVFLRALEVAPVDAVLLGAILLLRLGTQFFFGYVENYMFYYVAITAFVVTGWLALAKKAPVWLPLALLALTPAFHVAGIVYYPAAVFLLLPWWKTHRKRVLWAAAGIVAAGVTGVAVLGPGWAATRIADAFRYDILPIVSPPGGVPYGMFSGAHMADWANAVAHIVPFGFLCVAIGMAAVPWREYRESPVFRFLAGSSLIGLAASFVILPALGMARDWDMLSNFFIPLRFLSVYFLALLLQRAKEVRAVLLMLAVFGMVRWAGWIGLNNDEEGHLARAEMLTVPELSGTFPKIYYENLAKTYVERKEYRKAAGWYERYMSIDSTHPRILANLSDCYRALGDKENIFRTLTRSVEARSTNAGVYSNLAVEYINRGDTARAVALLNKGLEFDPLHVESHANLSILNMSLRNFPEGRRHAIEAIRLGLQDPVLFRNAGYASYFMKEYPAALLYLKEYTRSAPSDVKATELVALLERKYGVKTPAGGTNTTGRPRP